MKIILGAIALVTLTACSSNPKVEGFGKVEYIQRQEVIHSAKECVNARMKPNIQYVRQKTEHGTIMLPVLVTCEPSYNTVK